METAGSLFNQIRFDQATWGSADLTAGLQPHQVGQGLLYPALRKAAVTIGPGRTPSVAQFADALDELNRLTASLNCDRLFIYSIARAAYPITASKASYTIGLSNDPLAQIDFEVERPQMIEDANIILGQISYGLVLYTAGQWAQVQQAAAPDSIPEILYNDRAYPVSTLYFWGQPAAGQTLELFTWTRVPAFQTVNDVVLVPPQYEDAMVLNLAVRLAPHFQRVIDPNVAQQARESLMRLESINAPQPIAQLGSIGCCGGGYDIYSDT